jgi:hypothetical protein
MDPSAIVLIVILTVLGLWVWMIGVRNQGAGMENLGLRSGRQIVEDREALEADDLDQMLEAHNARRRRRGQDEVTVADLEHQVATDLRELQRRRDAYLAERERGR